MYEMARRRLSHRIRTAALVGAIALLCATSAPNARADAGSQRRAAEAVVTTYTRAIADMGRHLADADRAGTAYVRSTENACPGVLDPVDALGSGQVNLKASTLIGDEVNDDITNAMFLPLNQIMAKPYVESIRRLPWTGPYAMLRNAAIAVLNAGMQPEGSALCTDLRTFATNPLAEPPGTAAYFTRLDAQTDNAYVTLRTFDRTLESLITPGQRAQYLKAAKTSLAIENELNGPEDTLYKELGTKLGLLSGKP